jgi:hypothetical protein
MSDLVQGGTALSRVEHGGGQRCDDGAAVSDHPKQFLCGVRGCVGDWTGAIGQLVTRLLPRVIRPTSSK